jgi:branched-chain amino acid transport system ATP-binding protein
MIEVKNVVAGYTPEVDILRGMTLHANHAEIVTLLGPNGCGKSTLLKTIAGYLVPRSGSVVIDGKDVSHDPVHQKVRFGGVGFVPQTENIFSALTVRENLQVGGQYLSDADVNTRMHELCALYPVLQRKLNAPAASMSGGERQILALARALMPRPRVLLLDEPSAGLSPKVLLEVFEAIRQVRAKEEVTILMVEQNAMEALKISDRAYVLSLGAVALTGNADALMADAKVRELYLGGRAD